MPAATPPPTSPYAGLDYPEHLNPSTAAIGPLARDVVQLAGVDGLTAFAFAALWDQGRVREAMDLLAAEVHRLADLRDAAKAKAKAGPR